MTVIKKTLTHSENEHTLYPLPNGGSFLHCYCIINSLLVSDVLIENFSYFSMQTL